MKKPNILIVTYSADMFSVPHVAEQCRKLGAETQFLLVDYFPNSATFCQFFDENGAVSAKIVQGDTEINLSEIDAVWFRRMHHVGMGLEKQVSSDFYDICISETMATLQGYLESIDCQQMSKPSVYKTMDFKPEQIATARRLGWKTPDTLIGNNTEEAIKFVKSCKNGAIAKPVGGFMYIGEDGHAQGMYTSVLTVEDLKDPNFNLELSPMILQENVKKKLELRVTVVGSQVFCFSIDSQKHEGGKTDWRAIGSETLDEWEVYTLPKEIKSLVLKTMKHYKLNYGAFDIIINEKGEYVYLECNSGGEFGWLDQKSDFRISRSIGSWLVRMAQRRRAQREKG